MCFVCCRPLLKLVDRLLLVGMLRNEDIMKLLIMIHPETWDPTFEKGRESSCAIVFSFFWGVREKEECKNELQRERTSTRRDCFT